MAPLTWASLLSGIGFLIYGIECLRSPFMVREFERFGVARFRVLTGILEILGGLGVLVGTSHAGVGAFASLGLCVLMAMGVVTRRRVGDSFLQCGPAIFFCILNGWIFVRLLAVSEH